jgi:ABC-type glycerol-3-phosphate transport system permease component
MNDDLALFHDLAARMTAAGTSPLAAGLVLAAYHGEDDLDTVLAGGAFQFHHFGYGATLSVLLFLIVLALTVAQWQLRKRWVFHEQFFLALPGELEEAGRLDGLGRFAIFWRIALPLSRPALGAVAIFTFLHSWNLYLEPIVFLSTPAKFTLPQALTQFVDAYGGPMWDVQLSAATLSAVPVLVVFVIAQRQFIEGLAHTGLKG